MESDEGGSRSSSAEATYRPARVILIERCSAMQVGRDNQQFSVYRIALPPAALRSSQALAETLLSRDSPWSRDAFSHDAQPRLRDVAGRGYRSSFSGIIEDPRGDTLVIVRDSRNVQVGDRNVQHNEFRIRVSDTAVRADSVGMTGNERGGFRGCARIPATGLPHVGWLKTWNGQPAPNSWQTSLAR